ncbi:MAG: NAD-dependent deacylase [Deltaproteobacteria bacterium]|nr:NAD-dependent deacylase [Deltaproteobacteria bacterium]
MESLIRRAAEDIMERGTAAALTGSGMSAESGIPTFRDKGGFWEKYDPNLYAHIGTFFTDPGKPWQMVKEFDSIARAQPNPGHHALAELERMGYLKGVITQNVDNLHQQAGSSNVIEFHGNMRRAVCLNCRRYYPMEEISLEVLPPRCECRGVLKPDAVFFGEPIPAIALRQAQEASQQCRLMLVIGTSAVIYPAASLPRIAKESGAMVVEINPETTPLTDHTSDYIIIGKAGEILPKIVSEIRTLSRAGKEIPRSR